MRHFELGTTGMMVSEVGFGGIPIIRLDTDAAVRVLRRAYDRGITLYDTANAYRDSEEKIGRAFQGMRDKVVIATKTIRRMRQRPRNSWRTASACSAPTTSTFTSCTRSPMKRTGRR